MSRIEPILESNHNFNRNLESSDTSSSSKITKTERLVDASSAWGYGPVDHISGLEYLCTLKKGAAKGVRFEQNRFKESCYGGTCSAQSLNFIQKLLSSQKPGLRAKVLSAAEACKVSSLDLRTQQAALNAIALDPNTKIEDPSYAKVKSIVSLKKYKINHYTKSLPSTHPIDQLVTFRETVERLPEGIYFVRLLNHMDNYKLEDYGHSVVYLNFKEGHYFWDPMGGLIQIADQSVVDDLYNILSNVCLTWDLSDPRFYRIANSNLCAGTLSRISSKFSEFVSQLAA